MSVSIITPAYNAAAFIEATAQSVLAQTHADWEWIIVDDGSTDHTVDVIAKFSDARIQVVRAAHSGLPAAARNLGLTHARKSFVAFLDADDLWMPDKLAAQLAVFDAHPEVGLVFSKVRYLYDEIGRVGRRAEPDTRGLDNPGLLFDALTVRNLIVNSSVVVRRTLLGGFDEDPRQRGTEDYELWLRLARQTPFAWIERPLVLYRVHAGGVSGRAVAIDEGRVLALEKAGQQFTGRRSKAWQLFLRGKAQLHDGAGATRTLLKSLTLDPFNASAWVWLAMSLLGPRLFARIRRLHFRIASLSSATASFASIPANDGTK